MKFCTATSTKGTYQIPWNQIFVSESFKIVKDTYPQSKLKRLRKA